MQTVNGYIEGNTVVMVDELHPQMLKKDFIVHIVEKVAPKSEKKISREKLLEILQPSENRLWEEDAQEYVNKSREDRVF